MGRSPGLHRPTIASTGLHPIPVVTDLEVELLRVLRNATRHGFSEFNDEIGSDQQQAWWRSMRGRVKAWLYENDLAQLVGFGVLRQTEDGRWMTVVGVKAEHGGMGYGSAITHDLVERAPGRCYATARIDNVPAQRLHRPEDWEEVGRDDRLVYFATRPEVGWA